MWKYPAHFDVIVIGSGHAGCEAAHAAARMSSKTLLITMNLDTIAKMSCNPSIGGTAKGQIVREIDALGGLMGLVADRTCIQFRMLNASKGPAVRSPRAQADKVAYQAEMKHILENTPNLSIKQGTAESLIVENDQIRGVHTKEGISYRAPCVILSSGTFMRGLIHIGETQYSGGRGGDKASIGLSSNLKELGFKLNRLKTGTPPRIHKKSIDFEFLEEQPGDEGVRFSFDSDPKNRLPQISCHITYTSLETKEIIQKNIHRSPLYSGTIQGVGPRYCPSIEDKVVRFSERDRHQIFLEPEGLKTEEVYVNGISTSLPFDVQFEMVHSIPGLRRAEIMRPAYAIEYDSLVSGQIYSSLETKKIEGLFFAGQINGTTGYEEAAAQGLIAGINAASKVQNKPPFTVQRNEAYIGVMIDDLITKDLDEPYRMFTSRAEYRLVLRQDNADLRLRQYGYELGLIDEERYRRFSKKKSVIESEIQNLSKAQKLFEGKSLSLSHLLVRPEITYSYMLDHFPEHIRDHGDEINEQIEIQLKYAGYIERQKKEIAKFAKVEKIRIPDQFDYSQVTGLRNEAREKLIRFNPETLGCASRIFGVSPADLSILMIALQK